jgi:hypothetical protein
MRSPENDEGENSEKADNQGADTLHKTSEPSGLYMVINESTVCVVGGWSGCQ